MTTQGNNLVNTDIKLKSKSSDAYPSGLYDQHF